MRSTDFCPECARPTDRPGDACCHCSPPLVRDELAPWINVARVTNLAEAGFLVDELAGEGVDARILQSEDFSALADRWMASYLIQSPPESAQAAASYIRRHLAEMESYQEPAASGVWPGGRPTVDLLDWRQAALVILAGMATFAIGQRFAVEPDPRPPRDSLSGTLSAIGRPLVTEPAVGLPRHRLYYRRREQAWYLETDADGDGQYEAQQQFHAAGAGW